MTFTDVHMGRQKVSKSDFQSQFSMSKIIEIFLIFFFHLRILNSLEEGFSYFTNFFAKIYSLLTHVRKTLPVRSH